ncbi:MAG: RNB domain-containing ribonuclease [Parachlamydiaceae bacterium]|nr:RNB domain-containing ribonuclease [Parachlamydiaceae bacterium]
MSQNSSRYLAEIAKNVMLTRGFLPDFSPQIQKELTAIDQPAFNKNVIDLRDKLWVSIDNDDSRDLDQITFAEPIDATTNRVYVAIADVATTVAQQSAIDQHAEHNTTSVYTPAQIFPMLPEKLSTNLTSLNPNEDRLAIVIIFVVDQTGMFSDYSISHAMVHNHAKLAYNATGAWLETNTNPPAVFSSVANLAEQIRLQDKIAQQLKSFRHQHGMLTFDKIETKPVIENGMIVAIKEVQKNHAYELIEYFMITANTVTTRFLKEQDIPILRRIVQTPKRWDRIVEIAKELGGHLPLQPDSKALDAFLSEQRARNPETFSDLSLTIIKLIGKGEYVLQMPTEKPIPHFGLALKDYSHTTAPNRRFPDLITQRILLSRLQNTTLPYTAKELSHLALHCTQKEDDAEKVQRRLIKSAAAMLLSSHVNEFFNGIITGASDKGTWVRLLKPPVEGKVVSGYLGLDVGDRVKVQLVGVDIPNGYIDLKAISR